MRALEPVAFNAPCPLCKKQMMKRTTRRGEVLLRCEECEEWFDLSDRRLNLSKRSK